MKDLFSRATMVGGGPQEMKATIDTITLKVQGLMQQQQLLQGELAATTSETERLNSELGQIFGAMPNVPEGNVNTASVVRQLDAYQKQILEYERVQGEAEALLKTLNAMRL